MGRAFATQSTLALVLLLNSLSFGVIYYVDAEGGNDFNSGTSPETPWRTIAWVNASGFNPGDSVLFRRGRTWRETLIIPSSGEEGNPVIFGAYGSSADMPMINGADVYHNNEWRHERGNIWSKVSHLEFDPDFIETGRAVNKFIVTIDGQRFLPVAEVQQLREHTYAYVDDRLYVYHDSDPDEHLTESATRSYSIRMDGKEHVVLCDLEVMNSVYDNIYIIHASKHIRLERMIVHHAGTRGIQILGEELINNPNGWAEHITIEQCRIFNIGIRCDTAATDIGMNRNVRCVTVRNCTLYGDGVNWGIDGILTGQAAHGAGHVIENNMLFRHCENEIDFKGHWESPDKEGRTLIQNNIMLGSDGAVINIHFGSRDVDILYNHICDGATHGVSFYNHAGSTPYDGQEGNVTIAYNIIRDNLLSGVRDGGAGAFITAGGNRVYNNVILGNGKGVDADSAGIQFESPRWDIRNNIVWDNGDGSVDYQMNPNTPESEIGLIASHNLVAEDPMFIDATLGDFRLQAGSPAIDAGVELGYEYDMNGRPVPSGRGPDIGAYEWYLSDLSMP